MSTLTKMNMNKEVQLSMNALKTHVTISTIYGTHTESVKDIRDKLKNPYLLAAPRSMFQMMLDFYNKEKTQ